MNDVNTIFKELSDLGFSSLGEEYEQYLAEQNKEAMESMWSTKITSEYIEKLTLDDVLKLPFDTAHKYIDQFSMAKRIAILEDLSKYRNHLYEQTGRYGGEGLSKDEQISATDFRLLLGKIKHLEILQNWLYGIN